MQYFLALFISLLVAVSAQADELSWGGPFGELHLGEQSMTGLASGQSATDAGEVSFGGAHAVTGATFGYRVPIGHTGIYLAPVFSLTSAGVKGGATITTPPELSIPATTVSLSYHELGAVTLGLQVSYAFNPHILFYGEYGYAGQLVSSSGTAFSDISSVSYDETGLLVGHTATIGIAYRPRDHLYFMGGVEWRSYHDSQSIDNTDFMAKRREYQFFFGIGVQF